VQRGRSSLEQPKGVTGGRSHVLVLAWSWSVARISVFWPHGIDSVFSGGSVEGGCSRMDVIWVVDTCVGRKQVAKCAALHQSVGCLKFWMVSFREGVIKCLLI
jgi:hypothetical protein